MSIDLTDFLASIAIANELPPASSSEPSFLAELRASPPKTANEIADFILNIPVPDLPAPINHDHHDCCVSDHDDYNFEYPDDYDYSNYHDGLAYSDSDDSMVPLATTSHLSAVQGIGAEVATVKPVRSSCDELKAKALNCPTIDSLELMCTPCNRTCRLDSKCCSKLSFQQLFDERVGFWGSKNDPAPTDKMRASKLLDIIQKRSHSLSGSTDAVDLVIRIDNITVCAAAYARILGLSNSVDLKDAPGQYRRLIIGHISGKTDLDLLAEDKVKLDRGERFTVMKGLQKGFITYIAEFYADTLPAAKSKEGAGHVNIRVVPYRTVRDLYEEHVFQCVTADPPLEKVEYGSYNTFIGNFNEMANDKLIQLLGGKGSFQTCAICNHCLALKKGAAKRGASGRVVIDVIRILQRAHLKHQQIERQHCDTKIGYAKKEVDENGDPSYAFIELDAQALWTTMAGKLQKDRTDPYPQIEVRNIGARVVCGPIDHYISITTNDLIPGGANVMIEATRLAIEYLADTLSKLPKPLALPKTIGVNYDNCGENKNRTNLAWLSHLAMSCYFDRIELFFLFAGHTHSPLDQNFSVVSKAIANAEFIASPLAMEEVFLNAHEPEDRSRVRMVIPMEYYHDYVSWYDPVINNLVKNYGGPHRFLIERHDIWGLSILMYQWQTPAAGWADVWLPMKPPPAEDTLDCEAGINPKRFDMFGGRDVMLSKLGINASERMGDSMEAAAKLGSSSSSSAGETERRRSTMKEIARLEDGALAETNLRMEHQASRGRLPEDIADNIEPSEKEILGIEEELLSKNSKTYGYISMLKLSRCSDPDWLNKRPNILPNPDAWEQIEKIFAQRKEDALALASTAAAGHSTSTDAQANDKWKVRGRTKKDSDQDKVSATAEENSAAALYARFNKGAAQIVKTSNFFLGLEKDTRFITVDSDDIYNATSGFSEVVFTTLDKRYYENRSSTAAIKYLQRSIVARAAAEPWALLRLPEVTPALRKRKEEQSLLYRKVQEEAYANYSRLLSKRSHGREPDDVHREVITRDGKEVIYARSLDDMTVEMLKNCASKAALPGRSKMDKKKLKEGIETYLKANPHITMEMLMGDVEMPVELAIPQQQAPPRPSSHHSTAMPPVTAVPSKLSIDDSELAFLLKQYGPDVKKRSATDNAPGLCACNIASCNVDASKSNYYCRSCRRSMFIWHCMEERVGATSVCPSCLLTYDPNLSTALFQREDADSESIVKPVTDSVDAIVPATAAVVLTGTSPPAQQLVAPALLDEPVAGSSETVIMTSSRKRKRDHGADASELARAIDPVNNVAALLQAIATSGRKNLYEEIKLKINYQIYDTEFLIKLANTLKVDVSSASSVRRPTREGVMNCLISQFLLKTN
jgi:hypothetical protein